jgi:sarcosine oxidase, subunit alpha
MRISPTEFEIIDRNCPINFTFEGKKYQGFAGDTISSALLANGVKILGRSFKYHRPRSILSFANHDANIIMQNRGEINTPNIRADVTLLEENMSLWPVNVFGALKNDKAAILGRFSKFLPVGFYYKAFHTKALFPYWEKMFRFMTGLGKVDFKNPQIKTPKQYGFCDVLVIGAGASGISAALKAADLGQKVTLVDEGQILGASANLSLKNTKIIEPLIAKVKAHENIKICLQTYAAGYYADFWVPLIDAEKMTKMRAKSIIFATGGFEQPAVFRNNDIAGIMTASALLKLGRLYGVVPYKECAFLIANDGGYENALGALQLGIKIPAIIDLRQNPKLPDIVEKFVAMGVPIYTGACIKEAIATKNNDGLSSIIIADFDGQNAGAPKAQINCDSVAMAIGFAPALNLLYQANTKMRFDENASQFVPDVLHDGIFAIGKLNGIYKIENKIQDGENAADCASAFLNGNKQNRKTFATDAFNHPWPIITHENGKNFVDFDEDLQLKDFHNAAQEGFDNIELIKRYSTNGMGPSQGKHSNMNGLRILAKILGKTPQEVGTTTARPFFHPVPMGHLAGRAFNPERKTPIHDFHIKAGAVFMNAGQWKRPEYYQVENQTREQAIAAEVMNVHQNVGIIDVGTLGKLEIFGKDAAEFLERVYISKYKDLKIGRARYGVMCDETGVIIDDGVIARLGDNHFYFTTTTTGAAVIYRELSRLNMLWGLECGIVNNTGAYAAFNLAGPKSRELLAKVCDIDLSAKAFPFMGVQIAKIDGVEARLMRVGFVGEWGYEIHVPFNEGAKIWHLLIENGEKFGLKPFGVEAQRVLRLQKGHIIIGQDTDGLTTPLQAGLDWALKMDKPFFVGKRSLEIIAKKPKKQILFGFILPQSDANQSPQESNLIIDNDDIAGRITSICQSPILGRTIGLGYIDARLAKIGEIIKIRLSNGNLIDAIIAPTSFYDAEQMRQKEAIND